MSSKNDTIVIGVENMSQDGLVDVYDKLAESYRRLKQENEECKQVFHQQKLQVKMLISSQNDLQSELECINATYREDIQEIKRKSSSEIAHLKSRNHDLTIDKIQLETKIDELNSKLLERQKECEELKAEVACQKPNSRVSDSFSRNIELENENLQQMLHEMKAQLNEIELQGSEKQSRLEELTERLHCLEDNLESKKHEIEEKNDAMETFQEKINELAVELAMLKTAPDDANRKGNSLFAEVDDQRQKMKVILQCERSHYLEMKKSFNAKEIEIRRLKRENINIKQEILACSSLLARGEQIAIQTLSAHVSQLKNDNRKLEELLVESEKKLIDLAKEQNLGWIGSILSTASVECRDLKDKQLTLMVEKNALADNLNKIQRELAKARLDCVKFKMLIGRLVEANSISFNPHDFFDIGLDDEVLENLKAEKYETVSESFDAHSSQSSDVLNESTIALLGGRQRLGPLISPPTPEKIRSRYEGLATADKENLQNEMQSNIATTTNLSTPVKPKAAPLKQTLSPTNLEREKLVKFSRVVETKIIDSTQEQFEQSKLARKRQPVVVKRIVIPSKAAVKPTEKM